MPTATTSTATARTPRTPREIAHSLTYASDTGAQMRALMIALGMSGQEMRETERRAQDLAETTNDEDRRS